MFAFFNIVLMRAWISYIKEYLDKRQRTADKYKREKEIAHMTRNICKSHQAEMSLNTSIIPQL